MFKLLIDPWKAAWNLTTRRWATNLGGGSSTNGRDSAGKRLGIKLGNGSKAKTGQIIVRQRGFQYYPAENVGIGRDHTFWAKCNGKVKFNRDHGQKKTFVSVEPDVVNPEFGPSISDFVIPSGKPYVDMADKVNE